MRLLPRLLEEVRSALTGLEETGLPRSHPLVTTLLLLAAATVAATGCVYARITAAVSGVVLAASACDARIARAIVYPLLVSLAAALPAAFLRGYNPLDLVSRAVVPAFLVASVSARVGWSTIIEGLAALGVPGPLVESARMLPVYVRVVAGEMIVLMAAREARVLREPGLFEAWGLQASSLGELLVRSVRRAEALSRAVRARTLGSGGSVGGRRYRHDLLVYLLLSIVVGLGVACYVHG